MHLHQHFLTVLQLLLQVQPRETCQRKLVSDESKFPNRDVVLPDGWTDELSCVDFNELTEKLCSDNPGSPLVLAKNVTFKGIFYEQHFLLTYNSDCKQTTLITIQISKRTILSWIQKVTGRKFEPDKS